MKILFVSKNFEKRKTIDLKKCDPEEFVMLIDIDRCISCGACELACQIEHSGVDGTPGAFTPIGISGENKNTDNRTLYLPLACRHCETPCDYYSQYNFWTTCPKEKDLNRKIVFCDSCIERTQQGLWPACATRCSMKTIFFGRARDVVFALGEKRLREMGDVEIFA